MSNINFKIICCSILLLVTGTLFLLLEIWLPYSYYIFVSCFGLFICWFSFYYDKINLSKNTILVVFVLLFVFLINVFYIGTDYKIISGADTYREYAAAEVFDYYNRIVQVPFWEAPNYLSYTTGFPGLPLIIFTSSKLLGIKMYNFVMFLPSFLGFLFIIIIYIFMRKFGNAESHQFSFVLALLFVVILPFSNYWFVHPSHQTLGLLLYFLILYMLYINIKIGLNWQRAILIIILVFSLAIAHYFMTAVTVLILTLICILFYIFQFIKREHIINIRIFIIPTLILAIFTFIWWEQFATEIWDLAAPRISHILHVLTGKKESEIFVPDKAYPKQLVIGWHLWLFRMREFVIAFLSLIGFFIFWNKRGNIPSNIFWFFIFFCISWGVLFVFSLTVSYVEPYRLPLAAIPLATLVWGSLGGMVSNRFWIKSFMHVMLFIAIFAIMIGLWGMRYSPSYLYNNNINAINLGEHNTEWRSIDSFAEKIPYYHLDVIFSDDALSLYPIVSSEFYYKIRASRLQKVKSKYYNKWICFGFRELNTYLIHDGHYNLASDSRSQLKLLMQQRNCIYSNKKIKIWSSYI